MKAEGSLKSASSAQLVIIMANTNTMIQFITDANHVLKKNGIAYEFIATDEISFDGEDSCCGYFDANDKKLVVAIGKPLDEWFDVFVHEYCHFEQWTEGIDLWNKCVLREGVDALDDILQHFKGELELTPEQVDEYLHVTAQLERDCELRVLAKAEQYGLPIDINQYAKEANSYIVFYYAMKELKSWCKTPPYEIDEILAVMPSYIDGVDHKALAAEHIDLYKTHCV